MKHIPVTGVEEPTGARPLCCMDLGLPPWHATRARDTWPPGLRDSPSAQVLEITLTPDQIQQLESLAGSPNDSQFGGHD